MENENNQEPLPSEPQIASTQTIQPEVTTSSSKKPNKKILIILILSAILAGSVLAYFMFFKERNTHETVTDGKKSAYQGKVATDILVIKDDSIYFIDADNQLQFMLEMDKGTFTTEARSFEGDTKVFYDSNKDADKPAVGYYTTSGKQVIYEFPANTNSYVAATISPDESKIIYENTSDNGITPISLSLVDVKQGTSKVIYSHNPENAIDTLPIEWLDNNTIVYRDDGCRECDGNPPPILFRLDVTNGEWKEVYNGETEELNSAGFWTYPNTDNYIVDITNHAMYFENSDENGKPFPLYISSISKSDWSAKIIKRYESDYSTVVGRGKDTVYVTTSDLDKTNLRKLNTESGSEEIIELEDLISESSRIEEVIETQRGTYIYVNESIYGGGSDKSSYKYKILKIQPNSKVAENILELNEVFYIEPVL